MEVKADGKRMASRTGKYVLATEVFPVCGEIKLSLVYDG
jgi:hypothetical protein